MRKWFIVVVAIVLIFSCSACGNKSHVEELNAHIQGLENQLDESIETIQDLQGQVAEANQTILDLEKQLEDLEEAEPKQNSEQVAPKTDTTPSTTQDTSENEVADIETAIFNLLTNSLYRFDNPASVRVVKFHAYRESEETYYLTLTSENFLGGNLTDIYELSEDGVYGTTYTEKHLSELRTIFGLTSPSCDISQINHALEQYCQDQGLYHQDIEVDESEETTNPDSQSFGTGSVSGGGTFKTYSFD